MSIWNRLFGKEPRESLRPQRLDYLNEGLALERQGDFEAALTSYRLAFRDNPTDSRILLNMAIAFTKTGQPEEAIRHYKRALELDDTLGGARSWHAPRKGPTPSDGSGTRKARCATSPAVRPRRRCDAADPPGAARGGDGMQRTSGS
jgi:tetratricopeptide (TPR) repeat protein